MELMHGSPADLSGRSEHEIRVYEYLDALGISYDRTDHFDQPASTMEVCARVDAILNVRICKNLFLSNTQKTKFYLLIMPGDKKFVTKNVSKQLGVARLSFGPEEKMKKLLGLNPGSVSVMGLIFDTEHEVHLVIDADVLKEEYFGCHPCVNTSSLRFRTEDLMNVLIPSFGIGYSLVEL